VVQYFLSFFSVRKPNERREVKLEGKIHDATCVDLKSIPEQREKIPGS
jgi:hypothetical protein